MTRYQITNQRDLRRAFWRDHPMRTAPGAGIPRVRCQNTPSLFGTLEAAEEDREKWTDRQAGLFDEPKP